MTQLPEEFSRREALMRTLADEFAQRGALSSSWLGKVDFGWGPEQLKNRGKGIWNPREYAATLTIVSDPESEYDDGDHGDSLYRYSYEKPRHGQPSGRGSNTKLREAMRLGLPIVMFRKVARASYVPIMPVYVVKDEPENERFLLALHEGLRFLTNPGNPSEEERRYIARVTRQRLHQPEFRGRVMLAYQTACAVCHLKHGRLLDAAHIIGDSQDSGLPVVTNGLALCKIHHAAYDSDLLGISPDYEVRINDDLLAERDGPMLRHGLQDMHGRRLQLPQRISDRPDRDRLAARYAQFERAS